MPMTNSLLKKKPASKKASVEDNTHLLHGLCVSEVVTYDWDNPICNEYVTGRIYTPVVNKLFKPNKRDTYIVIFGLYQNKELEFFVDTVVPTLKLNILYRSKKCVNTVHKGESGGDQRTTMFIFEYNG